MHHALLTLVCAVAAFASTNAASAAESYTVDGMHAGVNFEDLTPRPLVGLRPV